MQTIIEAIEQLTKFSNEDRVDISDIITCLNNLELPGEEGGIMGSLRIQLQAILSKNENNNIKRDGVSLSDVAYEILLVLAELKPINEIDPITQGEIDENNVVLVSTGHQYNIDSLIDYHNARLYRENLDEYSDSKFLLHPILNTKFDSRDVAHIQTVATEKGIRIQFLKTETEEEQTPQVFVQQPQTVPQRQTQADLNSIRTLQFTLFRNNQNTPVQAAQWHRCGYDWALIDRGGDINRDRGYGNRTGTHIASIQLYGYPDGTYSITLIAGTYILDYAARSTIAQNRQLRQTLQASGIYENSENIEQYPTVNSEFDKVFTLRGPVTVIRQHIATIVGVVETLEGSRLPNDIRTEILTSFSEEVLGVQVTTTQPTALLQGSATPRPTVNNNPAIPSQGRDNSGTTNSNNPFTLNCVMM